MKNNLAAEQVRIKAIELYKQQWNISEICKTLGCSRRWFYKWLKRYQSNEPNWYIEQSRKPKTTKQKIDSATEQLILETRKKLTSMPFMQYGAQAIFYYLKIKDTTPPAVWSIARVLERNKVTHKKTGTYIPKGKKYPYEYSFSQQIDFVGPRYLYTKMRFYFLNIICCDTHIAQISAVENQDSNNACKGLIRFWKTAGIPDFLQMDNDLSFWGSLKKPNALGKVIRLCLLNKVTPVFIPSREPWRNGIIEHFNQKMQNAILSSATFENLQQIQETSDRFCEIHNHNHYYSSQKGQTPVEYQKYLGYPVSLLPDNYSLPKEPRSLPEGEIHIIRFIRSDHIFNLFGLFFTLPENIQYEYVKGIILTAENQLKIFRENELIKTFPFILF